MAQKLKKTSLDLQSLEDRRMLAVFGTAWPDARNLSVSFPADGVRVGTLTNEIGESLDDVASRSEWQELALRAYQTWSIHADINVGLRNDYNVDFGTPGFLTDDPRFGEFRIGGIPQSGLSASAIPYQSAAGTYSGDLLLNTNHTFRYHSWDDQIGPDPATVSEGERDIFSLFLHEVGNTLGVDDNQLEWSVMFGQYTVPKGILSQEDIAAIQAIYGERTDPFETSDNGAVELATLLPVPVGFDPDADVIRSRGSLLNNSDVDVYRIEPLSGFEAATIRVRTAGLSLLMSQLEVLDSTGTVIAHADSQSVFENDAVIDLTGLGDHEELFVRISASDSAGIYHTGDYQLELDYRDISVQTSDPQPGGHDAGPDELFANFGLVDSEDNLNDSIDSATVLSANPHSESRYQLTASVSSVNDVDHLRVTAPAQVQGRLAVHLAAVGEETAELDVTVVDVDGQRVGTAGRLRADGTYSIEIAQPVPNQDYYIRVSVDPTSTVGVGNYVAVAEFEAPQSQMNHFISGEVDAEVDEYYRWTALKTRLFRFDLSVSNATSEQAVRLTIYDAHTQEVKLVAVAHSGLTRSVLGWLDQGDYILRLTAITSDQSDVTGASFNIAVDGLSDDQDDDDYDPHADETSNAYGYSYIDGNYYTSDDEDSYGYGYGYDYGYGP
ncbi:MAG: matrixin family metalloprotease [Planctomycetota bacterium]